MQTIIGYIFLICGAAWTAVLLWKLIPICRKEKESGKSLGVMMVTEAVIFFIATMGLSDFVLNTIMFNRFKSADTSRLPGTLLVSCLVPGTVMAYTYLQNAQAIDTATLVLCAGGMLVGALIGGKFVVGMDGKVIKKILGFALIFSMGALILKMVVSSGVSGTKTGFSGAMLIAAGLLSLACGMLNMLGVPCKPTLTAAFLLMGLSPMCTLTLTLVMCGITPVGAAIRFFRSGMYHKKTALAATTAGTAAAIAGCMVMISLPAMVLNVLLLTVMLVAIITTFKK
ncbi:MAG: hypothetical protein MJ186_01095 [Clostridia bacterium]|nr:hypothetical protein [Clostridia bacterium]